MIVQIIEERLKKFENWSLKRGSHFPDSTFCVMEAVAYVAGEPWSDSPKCACPVISAFLRSWNDSLSSDAERDRLLKSFIPKLVNTRNKSLEQKRSLMAADWLVRVHTPEWLRLAGLTKQAESLEQLTEITSMAQVPSIRWPIEVVCQDAYAAWAAAWATAGASAGWADASWATAWATAGVAAGAAAWASAGVAAGAAYWAVSLGVSRDAAGVAAKKKLAPIVTKLQESALQLVERMIGAK